MGGSAGLTLLKTGGFGIERGRTPAAVLMAACTSWAAESMSRSSSNWSVTLVCPNELVDVIEASPLICPNWRSRGVVTDEAITSGLAPG